MRVARVKAVPNAPTAVAKQIAPDDRKAGLRPGMMTSSTTRSGEAPSERAASSSFGSSFSVAARSEEHTSELQSLMRISYAVFCLKKKKTTHNDQSHTTLTKRS